MTYPFQNQVFLTDCLILSINFVNFCSNGKLHAAQLWHSHWKVLLSELLVLNTPTKFSCITSKQGKNEINIQVKFTAFASLRIIRPPPPIPPRRPQKNFFWGNSVKIKPNSFFVFSQPSHLVYFLFSILHYSSVFDCKFIWKSYVNFSFIEFIFVTVKDF